MNVSDRPRLALEHEVVSHPPAAPRFSRAAKAGRFARERRSSSTGSVSPARLQAKLNGRSFVAIPDHADDGVDVRVLHRDAVHADDAVAGLDARSLCRAVRERPRDLRVAVSSPSGGRRRRRSRRKRGAGRRRCPRRCCCCRGRQRSMRRAYLREQAPVGAAEGRPAAPASRSPPAARSASARIYCAAVVSGSLSRSSPFPCEFFIHHTLVRRGLTRTVGECE